MAKKSQLAIEDIFSYLWYFIFFTSVLVLLNLPGCDKQNQIQRSIETDTGNLLGLRADHQLTTMLRTELPEKSVLFSRIKSLDEIKSARVTLGKGVHVDEAIEFLNKNPSVYVEKNYAGFISSLYTYGERDIDNIFDVVTRAVFYRHMFSRELREKYPNLGELYILPTIAVKFSPVQAYNYKKEKDLISSPAASIIFPEREETVRAIQQIPTTEGSLITVQLMHTSEINYLPQP